MVTIIPGAGTFFTGGDQTPGPGFRNYGPGAGVEVSFNRYVGVEGEVAGGLGIPQDLQVVGQTLRVKSPHSLTYNANLVVSAANRSPVSPYVTGGVGGLSLFERPSLGINNTETFLTANVGGGLKWLSGGWGLRADYRFIAVGSRDDAPDIFGREKRFGHRVYAGILLNANRRR
jgi:opacity protein-like surface antigen